MNKAEYLNELKEALKDTDKSIMEEIISDYEEHFMVGAERGKSEEQICEELGSIDDLIEEIKEVYQTGNKENKTADENNSNTNGKKSYEWNFNIPNIDGEKISDAINSALDSAGDAISKIDITEIGHSLKSTLEQATSSINNFTDTYLRNSFDFNHRNAEGYTENVSKSYQAGEEPQEEENSDVNYEDKPVNGAEVEKLDIQDKEEMETNVEQDSEDNTEQTAKEPQISKDDKESDQDKDSKNGLNLVVNGECAFVTVIKSSNEKVNINYENNGNERQKQMYEFYSYKEGNTIYAGIRRVGKAVFLFHLNHNSMHINVELPESMNNVELKTASGDMKLTDIKAERITVSTASGDVSLKEIDATDLRIKCSSGDIGLENINSIQLSAGTMSGDIDLDNTDAKFLSIKSTSGDIKARNFRTDIIDISSISGELDLHRVKTSECKIRTTSGDIDIDDMDMNNTDSSSISGDIKIQKIIGDGLRSVSTSGNVSLDVNVKRCHASSKSGNVEVKCEGDIELESNSTSGNIKIGLKNYGNGYQIESKTTSGALNIKYHDMVKGNLKSGTYTYGKQGSDLVISTVSGDIRVTD